MPGTGVPPGQETSPEKPSKSDTALTPPPEWTLTGSFNYETGDFGTSVTTNTVYVPITLRRNFNQGDILLSGHSYLVKEGVAPFNLSAFGRIKFPSADEDKGLGTGEFDETVGLEAKTERRFR